MQDTLQTIQQLVKLAEKQILVTNLGVEEIEDLHLIPNIDTTDTSNLSNNLNKIRVNGILQLNKHEIINLELALVLNETPTSVFRCNFQNDKRWILGQIHYVQNILKVILVEIEHLKIGIEFEKSENPERINEIHIKLLNKLLKKLIKTYNRLILPGSISLRAHSRSRLRTIFEPELPSNILVNIYCKKDHIYVDLTIIDKKLNPNNSNMFSDFFMASTSTINSSTGSTNLSNISNNLYPIKFNKIDEENISFERNKKNNLLKCNYEIGDEFNHPGENNQLYKVVNCIQLKASVMWLSSVQNLLITAIKELDYSLKTP